MQKLRHARLWACPSGSLVSGFGVMYDEAYVYPKKIQMGTKMIARAPAVPQSDAGRSAGRHVRSTGGFEVPHAVPGDAFAQAHPG